jgi:hypothetical protein
MLPMAREAPAQVSTANATTEEDAVWSAYLSNTPGVRWAVQISETREAAAAR